MTRSGTALTGSTVGFPLGGMGGRGGEPNSMSGKGRDGIAATVQPRNLARVRADIHRLPSYAESFGLAIGGDARVTGHGACHLAGLLSQTLGWRTEHGRFSSVDELTEVSGIGERTFADLKPLVRI
jgi:type II secretory pathway component PulK